MAICRHEDSKVKYKDRKYCRYQICRDAQRKVKYMELKYCRCQYAETIKAKWNIQN